MLHFSKKSGKIVITLANYALKNYINDIFYNNYFACKILQIPFNRVRDTAITRILDGTAANPT